MGGEAFLTGRYRLKVWCSHGRFRFWCAQTVGWKSPDAKSHSSRTFASSKSLFAFRAHPNWRKIDSFILPTPVLARTFSLLDRREFVIVRSRTNEPRRFV